MKSNKLTRSVDAINIARIIGEIAVKAIFLHPI